jgi:uncharacterized protein
VNSNRHPLRLNVGFIISQSIGSNRDFGFEFPSIYIQPDLDLTSFKGNCLITRTPQGLLAQGNFKADLDVECVRCLEPTIVHIQTTFDELYAFSERTVTDSGLILPEDSQIDLEPLVHEYLTLEIPIQPLCKPDCLGLCPECGENWNNNTCEHQSHPAASQ